VLTILQIAYPLAPVTADPAGGAEQILAHLDRAVVAAGGRSMVIAQQGSTVAGELAAIPRPEGPVDDAARARAHAAIRATTARLLRRERIDVIHLHGLDYAAYLPPPGLPAVVTLHLPLSWHDAAALTPTRPDTHLIPVSAHQAATAPPGAELLPPIPNGVDVDSFPQLAKRGFLLWLGRICPEKGTADALRAAHATGRALIVAGELFPYPAHRAYFEDEIRPLLDRQRRYVGPVYGRAKRRLLARADALLHPTTAPETSSLVAMEALAAGTPVIAYPSGALPTIIDHGVTGLLADGPDGLAAAVRRVGSIDPARCHAQAQARFRIEPMIARYLALYGQLASIPLSSSWRSRAA
jgi:glycosyltransferase involved in cell wall biosynthesis